MLAQGIAKVVMAHNSPVVPAARGCDTEPPYFWIMSLWALHINNEGWVQVVLHHADWDGCREMHLCTRRQL